MTSSVEKIRESFPFLTVDPIVGQPTYDSIKELHKKLNANAASIHSHLGNGKLGLLYLTVKPEVYNTLSDIEFVPPVNPGPTVNYPEGGTQFQLTAAEKAHKESTKIFFQYDSTDKALKQLLIGAVDDMFINAVSDAHVGYANVTTLELLTHLYSTYGRITDADLRRNQEIMSEDLDVNLPIESFFKRVEECVAFAAAGETPFTAAQVVSSAFHTIQRSGMFTDDVREWRRRPAATKTWENFKQLFARAYNELLETRGNANDGFHNANFVSQQHTAEALQNLANATIADKNTITTLTNSINSLTSQLASTNAKLSEALQLTTKLQNEVDRLKKDKNKAQKAQKYCWTHGPQCSHSSAECLRRAAGHQDNATEDNKMGGREQKWRWNFARK